MAEDQRKAELTADLARARSRIAQNFCALRSDLDIPGRLKKGVARNPIAWIGAAALFGVVLSKLPARRKLGAAKREGSNAKAVSAGKTGLLIGALKIAFDLSRPLLVKWAGRYVADYADGRENDRRFSR